MPPSTLEDLMLSFAHSLARANVTLRTGQTESVGYVINELDVSVAYRVVDIEGDLQRVEVALGDEGGPHTLRFRVVPTPLTDVTSERAELPQLRELSLEAALDALDRTGVAVEDVTVRFDRHSDVAPGTATR
jgi:hypothetical protein